MLLMPKRPVIGGPLWTANPEHSASVGLGFRSRWAHHWQTIMSNIKRYGFAVVSVLVALLPALLLQHYKFHDVELALFLFAVALTAWQAGSGPAVLSTVLASLCFDYFFLPPLYSLSLGLQDVPAFMVLISFAVLITWLAAIRRRIEADLLTARDKLQQEVTERTQQAREIRVLN